MMDRVDTSRIGPVDVAVLTERDAIDAIDDRISAGGGRIVTFCNAHSVNLARDVPPLADAYADSLVLNDGIGVDVARRLLYGAPFPANLNGTDFMPAFLSGSAHDLRLFLLGSEPGVAGRTADIFAREYRRHRVVGVQDGYFDPSREETIVDTIARSGANLVIVGMGQPRQELFAARHAGRIGATMICVGAYMDFVSGNFARAPGWMRRARLEWLFRLGLEPTRLFHRYVIGNPRFVRDVLRDRARKTR